MKDLEQLVFMSTKGDRGAHGLNGNQQEFCFYVIKWPKDRSGGVIMTNRRRNTT